MKIKQIRTVENVHMGVDLTKNVTSGKGSRFPGLSMEAGEFGVTITLHQEKAIVPWSNIIVASIEKEELPSVKKS